MLINSILGIAAVIGGILLLLSPFSRSYKLTRWAAKSFIISGAIAIIWGFLFLLGYFYSADFSLRTYTLIEHYRTWLGGFWLGIILTLTLAGQFKSSKTANGQTKASVDKK